ncbi:HAD family hydrolase [[Eubacterium] cellulosolvens]
MKPTLFIDFDNTLHDSDSKYKVKLDGLLDMRGLELWDFFLNKVHRQEVHKRHPEKHDDLRFHILLLLEMLGYNDDSAIIEKLESAIKAAERECIENPSYFPDAFPFLKKTKRAGYRLCLATGPNSVEKGEVLETRMSQKIFDHIFGEDILRCVKSDKIYYQRALQAANAEPSLSVMIGDSIMTDIAPAKQAGLKTIWLNRTGIRLEQNLVTPDYVVENLAEVSEALQVVL